MVCLTGGLEVAEAELVGIDESAEMLAAASADVAAADLRVSRLEDPLPEGNFDHGVSALAVQEWCGLGAQQKCSSGQIRKGHRHE
ncbi:MAG TPA: methyltransferase domain-containing protein [Propionibacteriaceae bacterium]|jgi:hypothetical protein|nr:methyltransferase domain-containing protein [Propionibacteriaceae bacterium]